MFSVVRIIVLIACAYAGAAVAEMQSAGLTDSLADSLPDSVPVLQP